MQSSIFVGQVSHSRQSPQAHAFDYRVFMAYLDLDELDEVFHRRWFWSTRRAALARFRREDHFGDPERPLADCVRDLVENETGTRPDGPIRLLTNLAYFGYCINPISLYYCYDPTGEHVTTVVAEVTNTPWEERHCYVLSDQMNKGDASTHRYRVKKALHVSPFIQMDVEYNWLLTAPADTLVVRINNRTGEDRFFNATLVLKRKEITGGTLASVLIQHPLMTSKVAFGIYWQAFRLWLKGCPVHTHPDKAGSVQAIQ